MANVTTTTAANFIPELWRDAILDYAERQFLLRNQVLDFSSLVANGGDTLNIPKVTEETAAAKSADTAVTYSANTCLLYTSPSPRDRTRSRMPSSA